MFGTRIIIKKEREKEKEIHKFFIRPLSNYINNKIRNSNNRKYRYLIKESDGNNVKIWLSVRIDYFYSIKISVIEAIKKK